MTTNIEKLGFNEPHQYNIEELIALKVARDEKKANAQVVDKFTGEIKRFRSMSNPGNYHDATIITQESVTDTSEYEPLETTIEKCSRSGFLAEYMKREKLLDNSNALNEDVNDFNFTPSPVEQPGFDLSQAKELEHEMLNSNTQPLNEANAKEVTSEATSEATTTSEPKATAE